MTFYPHPPPRFHQTQHFIFRPLTRAHAVLDYAAVLASATVLRLWSPGDDKDAVTPDANLAGIIVHEDSFAHGGSFAYTVLNPDEDRCEGALYVYPLVWVLADVAGRPDLAAQFDPAHAHIRFWIRGDRLHDERLLLETIIDWLHTEWHFPALSFQANSVDVRQCNLYDALGMERHLEHTIDDRPATFYLYRLPT